MFDVLEDQRQPEKPFVISTRLLPAIVRTFAVFFDYSRARIERAPSRVHDREPLLKLDLKELTLEESGDKYRVEVETIELNVVQESLAFPYLLIVRQCHTIDSTIISVRDAELTAV